MLCVVVGLAVQDSRQTDRLVADLVAASDAMVDAGARRGELLTAAADARTSAHHALLAGIAGVVLIGFGLNAGIARSERSSVTGNSAVAENGGGQADPADAAPPPARTVNPENAETAASIDQLSLRTRAMAENAIEMRQSAAYMNEASQEAATAAERTMERSQTVAGAAEELASSVLEITAQVNKSAHVVSQAVTSVVAARTRIDALNASVKQISSVADIIAQIAARTNLLALNATIEAARAGDAGKGFTVVAAEVKQLADQTAQSTTEIVRYIEAVLSAARASIESVSSIERSIKEIDEISDTIATAIEQQSAANGEIAAAVEEITQAADVMAERITHVSLEAKTTGRRAEEAGEHAAGLTASMMDLKRSLLGATTAGEAA